MNELNWLAILAAALSTMVVGSLWYGPLFGKAWRKMARVKKNQEMAKNDAVILYLGAFLVSGITAIVLAIAAYASYQTFGGNFLLSTLLTAFILWLGFTAARIYMHDSFEPRRKKLTILNVTHELVTILVMALIIGVWAQ